MTTEKITNPFTILSIDKTASKQQMLAQVTIVLRRRQYDPKQIAEAQKKLFNPVSRAVAEFEYCVNVVECFGTFEPKAAKDDDAFTLPMLDNDDDQKGTTKR